jgi:hypothetical protein
MESCAYEDEADVQAACEPCGIKGEAIFQLQTFATLSSRHFHLGLGTMKPHP